MPKRKVDAANSEVPPAASKMDVDGDDDSGSDDDELIVDVDLEWFNLNSTIDFHGLKTLLRQLFDVDNQLFELSDLSDLLLSQNPSVGSTVKCDGEESDPFAFLTVLDLNSNKEKPIVKEVTKYLSEKGTASGIPQLASLLSDPNARIGLIFSERLINMPPEIVAPLYNMLATEVAATAVKSPSFKFTHYLLLSRTYTEVPSELDAEPEQGSSKKSKKQGAVAAAFEVEYFHAEDEALHQFALAHGGFDYTKQGDEGASDAKRAFQEKGIRTRGHLILLEGSKLEAAVKGVTDYLSAPPETVV